jgi:uncharacterized membrane protein YdcZ (DUF606 family)
MISLLGAAARMAFAAGSMVLSVLVFFGVASLTPRQFEAFVILGVALTLLGITAVQAEHHHD